MTLPALDLGQSSAGTPSEGAIAPPGQSDATEPAPKPGAATEISSRSEAAPAKPPAASLVSIATKGKQAGPSKAGDLTRLFELARRQAQVSTRPGEVAPAELPHCVAPEAESAPQPMPTAPLPVETPVAELPPEPAASVDATPEPVPQEATVSIESVAVSEVMPEPRLPLGIGDATASVPAPNAAEAEVVVVPDGVNAAMVAESDLASETPEPLKAALAPKPETTVDAETPDPVRAQGQPAAMAASAAVSEPRAAPIEPLPAAEPLSVQTELPAVPAAPRASVFKELVDYWRSLRVGDGHPSAEAIDRDLVTERWPGTLLIAYTPASQDPRGELRPGRVTRLGTACTEAQSAVDAGSHSTEWMLEVARTALINDEPVEEQQRLATIKGVQGFRMVGLPLGPRQGLANAVLCTLAPSPSAPRFGKRRIWL